MKISTGSKILDEFLGGYEKGIVTTIYGPSGVGKTLLLMLAMKEISSKIIFVDTEGGFSTERFAQVCNEHEKVLERVTFLNPTNFDEQKEAVKNLKSLMNSKVDLIIIDTLTALYRIEMSGEDNYALNKDLARQLMDLVEIARKKNIPVLVTAQVYADMEDSDKLNVVGGKIVTHMSKCMLEIRDKELIVKKHRSMPKKKINLKIVEKGITHL